MFTRDAPIEYYTEILTCLTRSPRELIRYTVEHRRYFPLGKAKEQLLNPLLWDMHYRGARPRLLHDDDDDE